MWRVVTLVWLVSGSAAWGADADDLYATMLAHYESGSYRLAEKAALRALEIRRKKLDPGDPELGVAISNAAMMLRVQGKFNQALPLLEEALSLARAAPESGAEHIPTYLDNLAGLHQERGDPEQALALYLEALSLREQGSTPDQRNLAASLNNVAVLLRAMERPDEAYDYYARSLAIFAETSDPDDPGLGVAYGNLASLVKAQGDYRAASRLYKRSVQFLLSADPVNQPDLAVEVGNLADVLWSLGDEEGAREYAKQALRILEEAFPGGHPRLASTLARAGRSAFAAGDLTEAADLYRRSLAIRVESLGPDHEITARSRLGLASVLLEQGDLDAAEEELAGLDGAMLQRARLRLLQGRMQEARQLYAQAGDRDGYLAVFDGPEDTRKTWEDWVGEADADAVCEAMAAGSVLLDYVHYSRGRSEQYAVFVVSEPGCALERIELGDAVEINALESAALAHRIWTPVASAVREAERVIVAPVGGLAQVSFGGFEDEGGTFLIERHRFSYVGSASELISGPGARIGGGALLVGGVDYSAGVDDSGCLEGVYADIPGSLSEIAVVQQGWIRADRGPVVVLSGSEVSEGSVLAALVDKRFVHLATHGFRASDRCDGLDPMQLSGVVVAGVNTDREPLDRADGIVSAADFSELDLRGTELVLLSGPTPGVVALRRAFATAGVQSFIASLWEIPEVERAALLGEFYRKYLHKRRPWSAEDALRRAQLKMLKRNRRALGEGRPETWAGFVISGA